MSVNSLRGEILVELDGKPYTLCLTLGALASLEQSLGAENFAELSERFSNGTLSATDLIKLIAAGLQGAGYALTYDDVAQMQAKGGASGFVDMAARLLNATFTPIPDEY